MVPSGSPRMRYASQAASTSLPRSDLWLFSTSGCTDVYTSFVGVLPVYAGELQGRSLGTAGCAFDAHGQELDGEVGELVITEPDAVDADLLLGDENGSRYRASYFEVYRACGGTPTGSR